MHVYLSLSLLIKGKIYKIKNKIPTIYDLRIYPLKKMI